MNFLYFEENRKDTQSLIVKMGYMLQKEERRMGGGNVSQDQTSIICIDLKSFYASVECVERGLDPFKTNLVVADPTRSKSTICLAITPAMKALGIKNRCRIHEIPARGFPAGHRDRSLYARRLLKWGATPDPDHSAQAAGFCPFGGENTSLECLPAFL